MPQPHIERTVALPVSCVTPQGLSSEEDADAVAEEMAVRASAFEAGA